MPSKDLTLGFKIECKSNIINVHITNAILKYRNPYHQLVKFLFKFSKIGKNVDENIFISLNDVEYYFGLQKEHAEEVITSLIIDGFLSEYNSFKNENNKKENKIYLLNVQSICNLDLDPYKEIIKDVDYYFSLFPRVNIPDYLIGFKEIRASKDLFSIIPQLDINEFKNSSNREALRIPDQFIGISNSGMQSHSEMMSNVNVIIIPETKNGDFFCFLNRKNRLKWAEKDRIIEKNHPDYDLIKHWLETLSIEEMIAQRLLAQNNDFRYHLEFKMDAFRWTIVIDKINGTNVRDLLLGLEELNFQFDLRNLVSELILKLSNNNNNNCPKDLDDITIKCRIHLKVNHECAFEFFAEYLSRIIFNHQITYRELSSFIEKHYERFIEAFNLEKSKFPLPSFKQLKQYFWRVEDYRMAYLLMYKEDLL